MNAKKTKLPEFFTGSVLAWLRNSCISFNRLRLVMLALFGISSFSPVNAELVTLTYYGTIDSTGFLPTTQFDVGDSVEVSYTFESTTPDARPANPTLGMYFNPISDLQIRFGNYQASATSIGNLQIGNDFGGIDYYLVESFSDFLSSDPRHNLTGPPLGPSLQGDWSGPIQFVLQFVDPTATALSSDALPVVPLNPNQFVDNRTYISLTFHNPSNGFNSAVVAELTLSTPEEKIDSLVTTIDDLVTEGSLKPGQANGLSKPLRNALKSLEKGKIDAACSQLADFQIEVALKILDGVLTTEEGEDLIYFAESIRTDLGC